MAADHMIRASDSDREHAIETLRGQFAEGRLTFEEFDERTSAAFAATTWTDLRKLTRDLPVDLGFTPTPAAEVPDAGRPAAPRAPWIALLVLPVLLIVAVAASAGHGPHHPRGHFLPVIALMIFGSVLAWRWLVSRPASRRLSGTADGRSRRLR